MFTQSFYLEKKQTFTKRANGAARLTDLCGETWHVFTRSPDLLELLKIVAEKPLLNQPDYRITNDQGLPTIQFCF